MEKWLMNSKFTFKTLPDGSVHRTKVICTYCRHEMSYHWSTLSLKYHLQANASSSLHETKVTMPTADKLKRLATVLERVRGWLCVCVTQRETERERERERERVCVYVGLGIVWILMIPIPILKFDSCSERFSIPILWAVQVNRSEISQENFFIWKSL